MKRTLLLILFLSVYSFEANASRCLYISSYHEDYVWDAGQRHGLTPNLKGHCDLKIFYMDTKKK